MSRSVQELNQPPSDGITNVSFSPTNQHLLVSSWDKTTRVYDVQANCIVDQYEHQAPVLDCIWLGTDQMLSGSLDKVLVRHALSRGEDQRIEAHNDAIRCVDYSHERNVALTGSWDKSVKLWDFRVADPCQGTTQMPDKVYTMSTQGNRLVVGTAGRHVEIYDLRSMEQPEQIRESQLKHQTRSIRCFPDGDGYALSSTEGRVAMEYFDMRPEMQKLKYAFKCHRASRVEEDQTKTDVVYPVNVIEFHPGFGTFATGGGDGRVNIWDGRNKKRICQLPSFSTSISALSFSSTGDQLAIAVSYTFEEGEKDHPPDSIYIRSVSEAEVRPKTRK